MGLLNRSNAPVRPIPHSRGLPSANGIDQGSQGESSSSPISPIAIVCIVVALVVGFIIGGWVVYKMNSGEHACDKNELLGERFRPNISADIERVEGQRKSKVDLQYRESAGEGQYMLAEDPSGTGAIPT